MKALNRFLLGSMLVLFLAGCEHMQFARYNGQQQAWPSGSSFSDQVYDVPVFHGWPEKPYEVLGWIEFNKPNIDWNQADTKQAARMAKDSGGDALLLIPKGQATSQGMELLRSSLGLDGSRTVGVVLKWK